ncbi:valine--tRNA ligase [Salinarchaeum laminariae]|uniref:valine--tRNA ligase n=1 Tax=Salinarchaeum laminariae TaxID=869888 RepID=UPI0020BFE61F|nr:valine--tRNA ligase [Salinarchaeum laminariae]
MPDATQTDTDDPAEPTGDDAEPTAPQPTLEGEYDPREAEQRWQEYWLEAGVYSYDDEIENPDTAYSIDTPPPTVSGSLHMGHLYGSTLQDFAARFHRMSREDTFFPFGYDDNGIASERLTERELDIRHQDYSRREFQEKCREVCQEYEAEFTEKMQGLGMSIDWDRTYKTIEPRVQRISQLSFLDLYEQGREYRKKAPAIWCPDCETAISQVEMEDADRDSAFNDVAFELVEAGSEPDAEAVASATEERPYAPPTEPGDDLVISTTRPELLPACVAMFVHPDDDANAHLVGGTAKVPLFDHEVPIYEDDRVDLDTGTGLVMCCTFGDQTDIEWYQAHDLDLRVAIDASGTMTDIAGEYEGQSTEAAREQIIEALDDAGILLDHDPITHAVQVHERCEVPVEYRVSKQWYVEILDRKEEYLAAGREMDWYPEKMFTRYEHWIEGLEWDWLISRQRDSGIPFPVWYCADCDEPIVADREDLPVEPIEDEPPVDACPACGHEDFEAEEDVFDTWATSSLTPLINAGWDWDAAADPETGIGPATLDQGAFTLDNPELYPFDVRPQGHDIISFWLFHTVVKCYEHTGEVPFESVLINGHVLDENREKMSKSKGNVVTPEEVMDEFPVDAARFWAAGTAVGDDFPFKEGDLEAGERLLRKLWNASKLVDQLAPIDSAPPGSDGTDSGSAAEQPDLEPIDEWLLARQDAVLESVTEKFADHEYAKARTELRTFFWETFCDDYLEIAKQRLDDVERGALSDGTANPAASSAAYALRTAHRNFCLLFAPILPHVTEEIWQASYGQTTATDSLHTTDWPSPTGQTADLDAGETALSVISALRGYKTDSGLPLNADLSAATIYGDVAGFEGAIGDVMHVGSVTSKDGEAPTTTEIVGVNLDYATLGPEFGEQIGEFDAAIDAGEYEETDDGLAIAGETLDPDHYELVREQTYDGEGELLEADGATVIVEA